MIRSTQELGARTYYNWRLGIETQDFWNQYLKEPSVECKKYLYLIYSYVAVSRLIYIFLLHFLNTLLFITTSGCYKGCICTLNIAFGTLGLLGIWKQDNITELGIFWYLDFFFIFHAFHHRCMVGVEENMEGLDLEMTRAVKWCPKRFNF